MAIDLSVVVVTYECRDWARACIESIQAATTGMRTELIVLDNASSDGTAGMVRRTFPSVTLLEEKENVGFARGVNRAVERATGEYVLLLNPDVIVHEGSVERLLDFARQRPRHGIYGGRTLRPDGSVDPSSCWGQPTLWSLCCFATLLTTAFKRSALLDPESLGRWNRDSVREVGIVTGCLLMVSARVWRELGGFDERFFMYGEDADLSLRAARLGFRPVITPDAVVTHEVGASSNTRPDKMILVLQGRATLIRKHWPTGKRQVGLALLWLGAGVRSAVGVAGRRNSAGSAWREVWRARGEWLAGYPAADSPGR